MFDPYYFRGLKISLFCVMDVSVQLTEGLYPSPFWEEGIFAVGRPTKFSSFWLVSFTASRKYEITLFSSKSENINFNARFPEHLPAYWLSSGKYSCTIFPSLLSTRSTLNPILLTRIQLTHVQLTHSGNRALNYKLTMHNLYYIDPLWTWQQSGHFISREEKIREGEEPGRAEPGRAEAEGGRKSEGATGQTEKNLTSNYNCSRVSTFNFPHLMMKILWIWPVLGLLQPSGCALEQ